MEARCVYLLLTFVVGIGLLLAACGSAGTTNTVTETSSQSLTTTVTTQAPSASPEYGGTLTLIPTTDIGVFDAAAQSQVMGPAGQLIIEKRVGEDWARGAAGTGELAWFANMSPAPDTSTGILAESWEIPELGTIVFKVRRGVHWALNPKSEASRLMNGREVTADDWVASFDYIMNSPRSVIRIMPQLIGSASMGKTGPWEVTLKTPVDPLNGWTALALSGVFPTEVIARYGDMRDWRNVVGTGPFMLSDFVSGSSATLVRNPDYWQKDPVGPGKGNQLPYLDRIKMLVVTETSTAMAAFRTAKVDFMTGGATAALGSVLHYTPDLRYTTYLADQPAVIAMRIDRVDLPYKDKRVRQALMMATDFNAIQDLLGGEAEILAFPVTREATRVYMPLEEMPELAQSLYRYDPDKARQLLAEAGYPDGFTARITYPNIYGIEDVASTYQAMWTKVGIDLELQPKELGVFVSMAYARSYENMILLYLPGGAAYPSCLNLDCFKGWNFGYVSDPTIDIANRDIQKHVIVNMPEADRLYRALLPYLVEQAYYLQVPSGHACSMWWPWLMNYHGETPVRLAMYYWIERDLKEEMTGRR
jgi:peptide/nickel transport system substrate-binding protein